MHSEKEIHDAVRVLQDVCEENNGNCYKCTLRNESNTCGIICNNDDDVRSSITEILLKDYEKPRLILG